MKTAGTSIMVNLALILDERDIITYVNTTKIDISRNDKGFFNPVPEIIQCNRHPRKTLSEFFYRHKYLGHATARIIKNRISDKIWNSYFKFCVERNPYDKVVSMYEMNQTNAQVKRKFEDWIKRDEKLPYNSKFYTDRKGEMMVDQVIKYESLNKDLIDVMDKLGISFTGLNIEERAGHRDKNIHYRVYYNEHTKNHITEKFRNELELHNYSF